MLLKKIYYSLFLLLFFITFSADAFCLSGEVPFKEGARFKKKHSPRIVLEYHEKVPFYNEGPAGTKFNGIRPGFKIFTYAEKRADYREVGYIIVSKIKSVNYGSVLDISWLRINKEDEGKGYATAALDSVMGLYRKRYQKHFQGVTHFFFTVKKSDKTMNRIAEKLNFTSSRRFFSHPDMLRFEKPICPFKEGKEYKMKGSSCVVLKYHEDVYYTEGSESISFDGRCPGFKVFTFAETPAERREIGYVIVSETLGNDLDISRLRVKREEERWEDYTAAAFETVITLYRKRHQEFFEHTRHFVFSIPQSNNKMIQLATRFGFVLSRRVAPKPGMICFESPILEEEDGD